MYRSLIIVVVLLLTEFAGMGLSSRGEAEFTRKTLDQFPTEFGQWKAIDDQSIDKGSMAVLLVDDYMMRTYGDATGRNIGLYVGYFLYQKEGKGIHSPRLCLPGAGWSILKRSVYTLPRTPELADGGKINVYLMGKGSHRELFFWWYQGRGRIYANEFYNKFILMWDSATRGRTDGALVRVNVPVYADVNQSIRGGIDFITAMLPILVHHVPR